MPPLADPRTVPAAGVPSKVRSQLVLDLRELTKAAQAGQESGVNVLAPVEKLRAAGKLLKSATTPKELESVERMLFEASALIALRYRQFQVNHAFPRSRPPDPMAVRS